MMDDGERRISSGLRKLSRLANGSQTTDRLITFWEQSGKECADAYLYSLVDIAERILFTLEIKRNG